MDQQFSTPIIPAPTGIPAAIAMSPTPVATYGIAKAKAGSEDDFAAHIRTTSGRVRQDPGCQQYQVHEVLDEPGTFVFYERWATGPDLVHHVQQPYLNNYVASLTALIEGEFAWAWITPISPS